MTDLPKEYEAIRKQTIERAMSSNHPVVAGNMLDAVREAVERCYALACKPVRELTDAEISSEWVRGGKFNDPPLTPVGIKTIRNIIAAHIAKQREPEVVEFRAARCRDLGIVQMTKVSNEPLNDGWEWIDHDGKPQTFKVVV